PHHWIIGSDQIAVRGRTRLEKPGDYARACQQLRESSGKCVTFLTSVCLLSPGAERIRTETDICRVYFRELSPELITRYLRREQPYDCAASFKSETSGIALVEKIEGNDPSALIGLPLILLTKMMEGFGLEVL
ncbi:MAG: Maf family protein, partial [Methylococcaceae bacterium]|nr:Maf family protein [Methylococcaceae bacterium]